MLGAPRRDGGGRAVRQAVDDARRRPIDEEGTRPMASPPRPRVHPNGLQGGGAGHHSRSYQPEPGGRTGGEPQAGGEAGARLPSQDDADGLQGRDQPTGLPGRPGHQLGPALREQAADAWGLAAHACPPRPLEAYGPGPPRQVRQGALIPAMPGGRGRGTPRTARARGGRRALAREPLRRHAHGLERHGARGWEQCLEACGRCRHGIRVHLSSLYIRHRAASLASPKVPMTQGILAWFAREECCTHGHDRRCSRMTSPVELVLGQDGS
jgi:hypothetical protein